MQTYTANLWAGLVEVGGFIQHPDMELTQDQRDRLEMMEVDNIRLHDLDDRAAQTAELTSLQRALLRAHYRLGDVSRLSTHLWMGLVRLGGYVGSNEITRQIHSDLVDRNNELFMIANNLTTGLTCGRNDTLTDAANQAAENDTEESFGLWPRVTNRVWTSTIYR